eukprot:Lankesteria_metandrocarpae@DN1168_c0_g1_i1.p1
MPVCRMCESYLSRVSDDSAFGSDLWSAPFSLSQNKYKQDYHRDEDSSTTSAHIKFGRQHSIYSRSHSAAPCVGNSGCIVSSQFSATQMYGSLRSAASNAPPARLPQNPAAVYRRSIAKPRNLDTCHLSRMRSDVEFMKWPYRTGADTQSGAAGRYRTVPPVVNDCFFSQLAGVSNDTFSGTGDGQHIATLRTPSNKFTNAYQLFATAVQDYMPVVDSIRGAQSKPYACSLPSVVTHMFEAERTSPR